MGKSDCEGCPGGGEPENIAHRTFNIDCHPDMTNKSFVVHVYKKAAGNVNTVVAGPLVGGNGLVEPL